MGLELEVSGLVGSLGGGGLYDVLAATSPGLVFLGCGGLYGVALLGALFMHGRMRLLRPPG